MDQVCSSHGDSQGITFPAGRDKSKQSMTREAQQKESVMAKLLKAILEEH
jgi:hypothetical protein